MLHTIIPLTTVIGAAGIGAFTAWRVNAACATVVAFLVPMVALFLPQPELTFLPALIGSFVGALLGAVSRVIWADLDESALPFWVHYSDWKELRKLEQMLRK